MTAGLPYAEVIGDPIGHSKSPLIHNFWLRKLGIEAEYRATRVSAEDLRDFLEQRRGDPAWRGCNVTMPHKLEVLRIVSGGVMSPDLAIQGANLIFPGKPRLRAANTDLTGIVVPLMKCEQERPDRGRHKRVVVLGAGGVLFSLFQALRIMQGDRYSSTVIVARNPVRVEAARILMPLVDIRHLPWGEELPECDLLVNATPLGMSGFDRNPYDAACLAERDGILFEMIYHPSETVLVADARRRGLRIVDGLDMLLNQAGPSFNSLFGVPPPPEHDAELRALLTT